MYDSDQLTTWLSSTKFATASRELNTSSPAGDRPSGRFDPLSNAHPKLIQELQTGVQTKLEQLLKAKDPWVNCITQVLCLSWRLLVLRRELILMGFVTL